MTVRKPWTKYFMDIAYKVAERSTCDRLHVGAVIVRERNILSTGYNGSIVGWEHCDDVGHLMENSHCVSGDTVISKFQTGSYNSGHRSVSYLWESWQDSKKRGAIKRMKIRSMSPDGIICPDNIVDIWRVGSKPTLTITTSLGRSVRVTPNHRLYTKHGWTSAENLSAGQGVALNGVELLKDRDWLKEKYVSEKLTQVAIAELCGMSRSSVKRYLDCYGIRRREFSLGGWNTGMTHGGSAAYGGRTVTAGSARERSRRYALATCCDCCGGADNLQVHHVDFDPWNDSGNNLRTLCLACHNIAHTPHAKVEKIKFDEVVSVRDSGSCCVYDIETKLNHNFVGNGIVLHNCIRTVHAEANALIQAAKHGNAVGGATMYVTASPCWNCFKLIVNAGIVEVYCGEMYRFEKIEEAAQRSGIKMHVI